MGTVALHLAELLQSVRTCIPGQTGIAGNFCDSLLAKKFAGFKDGDEKSS